MKEEEYDSSEDADFQLEESISSSEEEEEEIIENVHQTNLEVISDKQREEVNDIWKQLSGLGQKAIVNTDQGNFKVAENSVKSESIKTETVPAKDRVNDDKTITISRTYEFAGETIKEEKTVLIDSEEAKAHLNSTKLKETSKVSKPLGRKRKRPSLIDAVISNSNQTKLSTLEKSRLDWASYVDKNKISDELKYKNRDGYLEKQAFLTRVDEKSRKK